MAVFKNKFFSKAGQIERLKNVAGVLKAPFTGGKNVANVKNATVKKVLEAVSNNPIKTALAAGTVANIPKAISVVKSVKATQAAKAANKAAFKQKKADLKAGVIKDSNGSGLLDLSSLGKQSTTPVSPQGGLIKPQAQSGGTIKPTKSSSPRYTKRRSTKRRVRRTTRRRTRRSTRRTTRRTKRRIGTAKQYARKGGRSVQYAKNGRPYVRLANGRVQFVKGKSRKRR